MSGGGVCFVQVARAVFRVPCEPCARRQQSAPAARRSLLRPIGCRMACLGLLVLVVQAAPLPSVDGMTDLAADGYLELKRRFQFDRTVGVIGSSGNLLYRSHGSEIDRLGVVMRFNGAVTAGYTNDVGVGGDSGDLSGERLIRCAWKHGWEDAKHSQQLGGTSVLAPHEFAIRTCPIAGCTDSYPVQNHPAITIEANWLGAVHRNILGGAGVYPSTGFSGLAVAVAVARALTAEGKPTTVHAYGFGACTECGKYADCTGENATDRGDRNSEVIGVDGWHPFDTERRERDEWAADGAIVLHEPSCDDFYELKWA